MKPLPVDFYASTDVCAIARELLGQQVWVQGPQGLRGGMITETEAYAAQHDLASHAAGGRRTARNAVMFGPPSKAYVYLCYGVHHLLNLVTGPEGHAAAVLIRGLQPMHPEAASSLGRGPGKLSRWLGIDRSWNGCDLQGPLLWVGAGSSISDAQVVRTPRIGVGYAGTDALLPYRFYIRGEKSVSLPLFPAYT